MHSEPQIEMTLARGTEWGGVLAFWMVVGCLVLVLLAFNQTFTEMVRIWLHSSAFTHGFLVFPVFLYFVWQRCTELATTPARPFLPAAALTIGIGLVWLLSRLASAQTPSFFAAVALVPCTVAAVLGWRWAFNLSLPLAFLFFAVPFGEVFEPKLMEWTADFTVFALRATGVPVYREGMHMFIPSGRWSVVEACSGIRYLLAAMFVGTIYAWMMYRSAVRRMLFFAAAILVAILANWFRAYLIVMLAHLTDNRLGVGGDHNTWGWIVFGLALFPVFAIGTIWREDGPKALGAWAIRWWRPPESRSESAAARNRLAGAAILMAGLLFAWPLAAAMLMKAYPYRELPKAYVASASGWSPVTGQLTTWRPQLEAAGSEQIFTFQKGHQRVGVFLGFYRDQRQGAELVYWKNQLVRSENNFWTSVASVTRHAEFNSQPLTVREQRLRGADGTMITAWQWYWLGGTSTASAVWAKFDLAFDRLLRRDDTSAWVTIYTVEKGGERAPGEALRNFLAEMGGALEVGMQEVARR